MRIVQSFWSCNQTNLLNSAASWFAPEYKLMGWALSCLQLKQYYSEVVLYTDTAGALMLVDKIKLPYTKVLCNLDQLNKYDPQLWALPKIYTYSQQDQPFLHIDGDVFIWKQFDNDLLESDLIAQNIEIPTEYDELMMRSLEAALVYFPTEVIKERKLKNQMYTYNAGVLGGSNIDFFKRYTKKAFEFVDNNTNSLNKINITNFNIFFEQYLFYCLAKKENKRVNVLLKENIINNEYLAFGSFTDIPHNKQYLHLLGINKRNKTVCEHMADRLRQDYPEYYYRIIALFRNSHTPLIKDFYFSVNISSEDDLVARQKELKKNYASNQLKKNNAGKSTIDKSIALDFLSVTKEAKYIYDQNCKEFSLKNSFEIQIADLEKFCKSLNIILANKLNLLSNDYLYGRDLNITSYYQYLFGDKLLIYNKTLVADDTVEIIESKFDWSGLVEKGSDKIAKTIKQFQKDPADIYTAIIPECEVKGFTASNMDELDILIFQTLKIPLTIQKLLEIVEVSFDAEELREAKNEYEMLIFERIEIGIQFKTIKVLF